MVCNDDGTWAREEVTISTLHYCRASGRAKIPVPGYYRFEAAPLPKDTHYVLCRNGVAEAWITHRGDSYLDGIVFLFHAGDVIEVHLDERTDDGPWFPEKAVNFHLIHCG